MRCSSGAIALRSAHSHSHTAGAAGSSIVFSSSVSAARCVSVVTQVSDPVRVLAYLDVELFGNVLEERGKEVDILHKDVRVLHAYNRRALEFAVLEVSATWHQKRRGHVSMGW